MGFFWFVIGVIAGMAAAWYYLNQQFEARLAERDREIDDLKSRLSSAQMAAKTELLPSSPVQPNEQSRPSPGLDDLTRIKGIGPVLNEKLSNLGITTFQQIADFGDADIEHLDKELNFRGRIEREKWIEQAKALLEKH